MLYSFYKPFSLLNIEYLRHSKNIDRVNCFTNIELAFRQAGTNSVLKNEENYCRIFTSPLALSIVRREDGGGVIKISG